MKDLSVWVWLILFAFFFLFSGKKKKEEQRKEPPVFKPKEAIKKRVSIETPVKKESKTPALFDLPKKKKTDALLSKNWKTKSSLKRAFILSEVLRRIDERERML
jgi:hypothetical protein